MFSQVEDLLPVISFGSKKDGDSEKKHEEFVLRMVGARLHRAASPPPGRVVHAGQAGRLRQRAMHIIDRRLNPGGKSFANRQRFMRRARALVRRAVREASSHRSIKDAGKGGEISVPAGGVHEPSLRRSAQGGAARLCAARQQEIHRRRHHPASREARAASSQASDSGEGEDEFRFALSDEEYLDLYLEDLELPGSRQAPGRGRRIGAMAPGGFLHRRPARRASRCRARMRNSLSRRIALQPAEAGGDRAAARKRSRSSSANGDLEDKLPKLRAELERQRRARSSSRTSIPLDVRYRRLESTPKPIARAVMFCLMDVSGSMNEHMKDLAKRFYSLLYLFLNAPLRARRSRVHPPHARSAGSGRADLLLCRETGGTVVSTALVKMAEIVQERFPVSNGTSTPRRRPTATTRRATTLSCSRICATRSCRSASTTPMSKSAWTMRTRRRQARASLSTNLWRAYRRVARRCAVRDAQGAPSPRHLSGVPRIVRAPSRRRGRGERMMHR